jgi:hypothetical protein
MGWSHRQHRQTECFIEAGTKSLEERWTGEGVSRADQTTVGHDLGGRLLKGYWGLHQDQTTLTVTQQYNCCLGALFRLTVGA